MTKCQRCHKETDTLTMSFFNTDMCCEDCIEKERSHPDFKKARDKENEEVRKGNYNYEGIGLPEDLK